MLSTLFRLPSILYFVLGGIAVLGGIGMLFASQADDSERVAALKHSAPQEVIIDEFDPAKNVSDYDEVVVRGQVDLNNMIESVEKKRSREVGRTLFIPVYGMSATEPGAEVPLVVVIDGTVTDEQIANFLVEDGKVGPVGVFNGLYEDSTSTTAREAKESLARAANLKSNFYVVKPFMNGREKDLKPENMGITFLIFGIILGLALVGYGFFRRQGEGEYTEEHEGYS